MKLLYVSGDGRTSLILFFTFCSRKYANFSSVPKPFFFYSFDFGTSESFVNVVYRVGSGL